MGVVASWRLRGYNVAVFKKGPDYIDAAWLGVAAGSKARNLDVYMMGSEKVSASFINNSQAADVCLIEGNRGLFDGLDSQGTHSTAELAKLLKAPVILIKNVTKVTRTAAAEVQGCINLDVEVDVVGVILNRVAGERHERVVRESIESICGIPILGAIPKIPGDNILPDRHLGLVTPQEHPDVKELGVKTAEIIDKYIDTNRILELASKAPVWNSDSHSPEPQSIPRGTTRIAFFQDSAFTFYYQDNLDALAAAGAVLIPVSSLQSRELPPCDGLYIGGGFPETHAEKLAENKSLLESVHRQAVGGLPIFAECGGLIYLSRSIIYGSKVFSLANVFPIDLQMEPKPQGHGYMEVSVDTKNPFFPVGTVIRGHEFHYTRIAKGFDEVRSIYNVKRGKGCDEGRDGLAFKNVLASYLHIHAGGVPAWAGNFVRLAIEYKENRK